jgi:hypothetical protein
MPNVKHTATATDAAGMVEMVAVHRTTIVHEQSALFPTRLALARWTMGGDFPHLHGASAAKLPLRAAWYASATRNFQEWIECGGFSQHEEDEAPVRPDHQPDHQPPVADGAAERADACID